MRQYDGASDTDPRVFLRLQTLALASTSPGHHDSSRDLLQLTHQQVRAAQAGGGASALIEQILGAAASANGEVEVRLIRTAERCVELQQMVDALRLRYFAKVREWRESHSERYERSVSRSLDTLIRNDVDAVMSLSEADLRGVHLMLSGQHKRVVAEFATRLGEGAETVLAIDDLDAVTEHLLSECEPMLAVESMTQLLTARTRGMMTYRPRDVLDGMERDTDAIRPLAKALIELSRAVDELRNAEKDEQDQFSEARASIAINRWDRATEGSA